MKSESGANANLVQALASDVQVPKRAAPPVSQVMSSQPHLRLVPHATLLAFFWTRATATSALNATQTATPVLPPAQLAPVARRLTKSTTPLTFASHARGPTTSTVTAAKPVRQTVTPAQPAR